MPKHILVVDDNAEVREIMTLTLEERGYRVTSVKSGASMREYLKSWQQIDVVILDWLLPGETGEALALRAKKLNLPVVIVSGTPDPMEFAKTNSLEVLIKPFTSDALIAAILNAFVQAAEIRVLHEPVTKEAAELLRRKIALLRGYLRDGAEADLAVIYRREIAGAEAELRGIEDHDRRS